MADRALLAGYPQGVILIATGWITIMFLSIIMMMVKYLKISYQKTYIILDYPGNSYKFSYKMPYIFHCTVSTQYSYGLCTNIHRLVWHSKNHYSTLSKGGYICLQSKVLPVYKWQYKIYCFQCLPIFSHVCYKQADDFERFQMLCLFVTIWASCTEEPYWAVYDNQIYFPMGASSTEEPGRAVHMMSGFIFR